MTLLQKAKLGESLADVDEKHKQLWQFIDEMNAVDKRKTGWSAR